MADRRIVVVGATGQLGRLVIEQLLAAGRRDVLATGRALDKLADLDVRTARVDLDDPSTLAPVLSAGDDVVLISTNDLQNRVAQHRALIDAARAAGVARIVYTSAPRADDTPLVLAPDHAATEELLRDSGVPATVLRNNWYHENYAQQLEQARATGELVSVTGGGRVASAARADYAASIVAVLTTPGHEGQTYELSGDVAWTGADLAEALSDVLEQPIALRRVDEQEQRAELLAAGLDEGTAGFVAALDANIRDGALDVTTGDLARLIGRPTTPLVEGLRALA